MISPLSAAVSTAADSGFYVGANAGYAGFPSDTHFNFSFPAETFSSSELHTHATAWGFDGGYRFNRYFAVEGGYTNFGRLSGQLTTGPVGSGSQGEFDYGVSAVKVGVVGTLPFGNWEVFGKLDLTMEDIRLTASGETGTGSFRLRRSDRSFAPLEGVGVGYNFNDHWSAKLEFDHAGPFGNTHEAGRATVNVGLVGIYYRF
ncbi:MAG TPA: outer membrane beta-barrel protein [Steroidobacteraceae bacterium]